jgi:four helix bundle protein
VNERMTKPIIVIKTETMAKYNKSEKEEFVEKLYHRTKSFALRCVRVYRSLPEKDFIAQHYGKQLVRSSSSTTINYRAVRRARSQNEFFAKLSIVVEELDESIGWLEMLIFAEIVTEDKLAELIAEGTEILKVLAKARSNTGN